VDSRGRKPPLHERSALVLAGVKALGEMNDEMTDEMTDEIVTELAWQMGGLSIIGFHNLTRPMSIHFKKS
jgi:hypothetical protein